MRDPPEHDGKQLARAIVNLSPMQTKFVLEYIQDWNGTQAAIRAGYSPKTAEVKASQVLAQPKVKAYLAKFSQRQRDHFEISSYEVLRHLVACALRDGKQFVDDKGMIVENIKELPDEVTHAIDQIDQTVKQYRNEDGEIEYEILSTKIKLVPKDKALEMCMRHKGLFAQMPTEVKNTFIGPTKIDITSADDETLLNALEAIYQRKGLLKGPED